LNQQRWRRKVLADIAGQRIEQAAQRITAQRGVTPEEAMAAVYADEKLLAQCHDVTGAPIPDPPESAVGSQNAGLQNV
jgi:hypothetical protein